MITAYDAIFAKFFDNQIDIILVGNSLHMNFNGDNDTIGATLDKIIYHTKAIRQRVKKELIAIDMPFLTYLDKKSALKMQLKHIKIQKQVQLKLKVVQINLI